MSTSKKILASVMTIGLPFGFAFGVLGFPSIAGMLLLAALVSFIALVLDFIWGF